MASTVGMQTIPVYETLAGTFYYIMSLMFIIRIKTSHDSLQLLILLCAVRAHLENKCSGGAKQD